MKNDQSDIARLMRENDEAHGRLSPSALQDFVSKYGDHKGKDHAADCPCHLLREVLRLREAILTCATVIVIRTDNTDTEARPVAEFLRNSLDP